jgi:hypothetical protein
MCVIRMMALVCAMTACLPALAEFTSYHNAHPVGWMNEAPVGEMPGWSAPHWFNLEVAQANIWNLQGSFTDNRTGDVYTYKADYEQTTTVLDTGFAMGPLSFSVEVPYANHNSGFLDDFIDQFHMFGHFDRFLREDFPKFGNHFAVQKNGQTTLVTDKPEGVGNIRTKLKWWIFPWRSPTPGVCECGFAVSAQVKFPVQRAEFGLTNGKDDVTGMIHLGVPIGTINGAWFTAAVSKNGYNETFAGWPQRQWQQMYELSLNIGIDKNIGILAQARMESPLFEQKYLTFNYTQSDPESMGAEREASAWNALTEWRGSENIGLIWRWGQGSSINFLIVEDWGLGDRDHIGTWNYVNDSPDVSFVTQWHFVF